MRWVMSQTISLFDLHCDTAYECAINFGTDLDRGAQHISLDRARDINVWIQDYAIFMPDELRGTAARDYYCRLRDFIFRQEQIFSDRFLICRSAEDLDRAAAGNLCGCLISVEGGSAAAGSLDNIRSMYADGVRMMTLTWNKHNEIASSIYDSIDMGLTDFGRAAVELMNELDMIIDVSHLSDKGFRQVAELSTKPFVASHSDSRTLCPHRRNLTDDMFRCIVSSGGLVGLNFYHEFLTDGGVNSSGTDILRHCEHFLSLGGEKTVCIGSDFDGGKVPDDIAGIEFMPRLYESFLRHYPEALVRDIFFNNAFSFMHKALAHEF